MISIGQYVSSFVRRLGAEAWPVMEKISQPFIAPA